MRSTGIVHVHTAYSHDGRDEIPDLARWATERGIQFIGITDHAEDLDEDSWNELVAECAAHSSDRVLLIPGLEFRFAGFTGVHLLACGLTRWITPTTPAQFIEQTAKACALTIGAHPVIWRAACPDDVLTKLDAVEIWNAGYNSRFLPDPAAMARVRALRGRGFATVATVGPDQHDRRKDPELRIVVNGPVEQALQQIKHGSFVNERRGFRIEPDVAWSAPKRAGMQVVRSAFDLLKTTRDRLQRARR